MYRNGTGNQCTLSNINIFAWQIKRKKKKKMCVCGGGGGEGKGNEHCGSILSGLT